MCVSTNKRLMRFQNFRHSINAFLVENGWIHELRIVQARSHITQVGFKYITPNCKHLDAEGEFRFYVFCITFLIATIFAQDSP
jgi:hypothetical protein